MNSVSLSLSQTVFVLGQEKSGRWTSGAQCFCKVFGKFTYNLLRILLCRGGF